MHCFEDGCKDLCTNGATDKLNDENSDGLKTWCNDGTYVGNEDGPSLGVMDGSIFDFNVGTNVDNVNEVMKGFINGETEKLSLERFVGIDVGKFDDLNNVWIAVFWLEK